ncbi:MAG: aminoacyl-tRNA hydrolase [Eubacteriales bacterium]|nr:aminoacyl-tRNA hydrolase [Eubacteriales bacterium]MDD4389240.1 aminoacyl-tRNA hydrolase [Eubacteriales bacterium]
MYIIVGLGNPGRQYEKTRHNMGFIAVDKIAEELGIRVDKIKFKALVGEGNFCGQKVILVKPQTYMNLSGRAVKEITDFYKLDLENLIVIYDDIDINLGKIRIRKRGSAGTHNGMRDIIYHLYDDGFPRIRIGIGNSEGRNLKSFVIGKITKEDVPLLEDAINRASRAALAIIENGIDAAMNGYNVREKKEKDGTETD